MPMISPNDINYGNAPINNYLQGHQGGGMGLGYNGGIQTPSLNGNGLNFGGLGFNMDTAKLALGGVQTLGNLWNSFQAQALARDQFDFTKGITETNLTNQIKSYNTSIEDRIRARGAVEGQTQQQQDEYLNRNRVTR